MQFTAAKSYDLTESGLLYHKDVARHKLFVLGPSFGITLLHVILSYFPVIWTLTNNQMWTYILIALQFVLHLMSSRQLDIRYLDGLQFKQVTVPNLLSFHRITIHVLCFALWPFTVDPHFWQRLHSLSRQKNPLLSWFSLATIYLEK